MSYLLDTHIILWFDRMLIATAVAENMTLLTADKNIHQYDAPYIH